MAATAAPKPGTGNNRMTDTGFTVPLVERVELPGTTQVCEIAVECLFEYRESTNTILDGESSKKIVYAD